jgi:hypothetical protein
MPLSPHRNANESTIEMDHGQAQHEHRASTEGRGHGQAAAERALGDPLHDFHAHARPLLWVVCSRWKARQRQQLQQFVVVLGQLPAGLARHGAASMPRPSSATRSSSTLLACSRQDTLISPASGLPSARRSRWFRSRDRPRCARDARWPERSSLRRTCRAPPCRRRSAAGRACRWLWLMPRTISGTRSRARSRAAGGRARCSAQIA